MCLHQICLTEKNHGNFTRQVPADKDREFLHRNFELSLIFEKDVTLTVQTNKLRCCTVNDNALVLGFAAANGFGALGCPTCSYEVASDAGRSVHFTRQTPSLTSYIASCMDASTHLSATDGPEVSFVRCGCFSMYRR